MHNGISVSREEDSPQGPNIGGGRKTKAQIAAVLGYGQKGPTKPATAAIVGSSAALTGVWAEANTRDAIYAAFRRKETFATSGTRLKVRFFASWSFAANLTSQPDWLKAPMRKACRWALTFRPAARARCRPLPSRRLRIRSRATSTGCRWSRVWLDQGVQKERVFDAAWSGKRRIDARTGKLAPVGDTVDLKTGRYTNTIGAAQLATVWRDPMFRADQSAVYYVRVIEIPTPR